jgi:hypothetical protein
VTATTAFVPVGRRRPPVDVAASEDLADMRRIGDDLLAHGVKRDLVATRAADLDRLGRRCKQVLDDLVVDLEVARSEQELFARVASDEGEDVLREGGAIKSVEQALSDSQCRGRAHRWLEG